MNDLNVLIITGPSGAGKDSLVSDVLNKYSNFTPASYNTQRPPRSTISHNDLIDALKKLSLVASNEAILELKKQINPIFAISKLDDNNFIALFKKTKTAIRKVLEEETSFNDLLNFAFSSMLLRAIIHLNTENAYINWIGNEDKESIIANNDDLCATTINGYYYAQCTSDVIAKIKNNKTVIVNATPDTWFEIKEKLDKVGLNYAFAWLECNENIREKRMLDRKDGSEKVKSRLEFDRTIWNKTRKQEVASLNVIYLNGNDTRSIALKDFEDKIVRKNENNEPKHR